MIVPVILSGGSGSRLWPVSREYEPKQLLALLGDHTMLQETVRRLTGLSELAAPVVVCNEIHRFLVAEQLEALGHRDATVLVEGVARGTASAAAAAACLASDLDGGEEAVLLVLPADHRIAREERFRGSAENAIAAARDGHLVTFGIVPTHPETGFGYIRAGETLGGARRVEEFVEKPDREHAERYLAAGNYLWNSGMFVFKASRYLDELSRFSPDTVDACRAAVRDARRDAGLVRLGDAFAAAHSDSIDYAVMEKTDAAVVVPLDAEWSDVGSFAALHDTARRDDAGNATEGDVIALDCEGSYLRASGRRLLTGIGLRDMLVVETPDATLVAPKERAQEVKDIVDTLRQRERPEASLHRRVRRPWGCYDGIDSGPGFQVKRLEVLPGAILSLQKHHRRAEHWVVAQGVAHVTLDDEIIELGVQESIDIAVGAVHRVENRGDELLILIEVQLGDYLGEDDIVRLEDKYGREGER